MRSLLLLALVTGCLPDEHDPGDYSLTLTVNTSAAGTIDRLEVLGGATAISVGGELPTAPITPQMLASGEAPPASARIVGGGPVGFATPVWLADHSGATLVSTDVGYDVLGTYGVVVGYRGGVAVAAGELPAGQVVPSSVAASDVTPVASGLVLKFEVPFNAAAAAYQSEFAAYVRSAASFAASLIPSAQRVQ